jgi:hypothetical protein
MEALVSAPLCQTVVSGCTAALALGLEPKKEKARISIRELLSNFCK